MAGNAPEHEHLRLDHDGSVAVTPTRRPPSKNRSAFPSAAGDVEEPNAGISVHRSTGRVTYVPDVVQLPVVADAPVHNQAGPVTVEGAGMLVARSRLISTTVQLLPDEDAW